MMAFFSLPLEIQKCARFKALEPASGPFQAHRIGSTLIQMSSEWRILWLWFYWIPNLMKRLANPRAFEITTIEECKLVVVVGAPEIKPVCESRLRPAGKLEEE
jgi:hypothetical protein